MTAIPARARAVIIGGGVSGCSVAYHLAKLGWTDVVLLERKQLTSGTTWHAAGLIGQLRASQNMTRLAKYSADLYVRLEEETGVATIGGPDFGVHGEGYIRLSYANSTENIRRAIERIDVIACFVKPVAHRFPGEARAGAGGHRFLGDGEPFLGGALGGVERDETVGDLGPLLRQPRRLVCIQGRDRRVRQCLAQRRQPARGRLALDRRQCLRIMAGERGGDGGGQRALAGFELREIAHRQPEPRRHRALVQPRREA